MSAQLKTLTKEDCRAAAESGEGAGCSSAMWHLPGELGALSSTPGVKKDNKKKKTQERGKEDGISVSEENILSMMNGL